MQERISIDDKLTTLQSKGGYAIEVKVGYATRMMDLVCQTMHAVASDALELESELEHSQEVSEELARELYLTQTQLKAATKEETDG